MVGFIFNVSSDLPGTYHCTTDEGHKNDLDLLTVIVDTSLVSGEGKALIQWYIKVYSRKSLPYTCMLNQLASCTI